VCPSPAGAGAAGGDCVATDNAGGEQGDTELAWPRMEGARAEEGRLGLLATGRGAGRRARRREWQLVVVVVAAAAMVAMAGAAMAVVMAVVAAERQRRPQGRREDRRRRNPFAASAESLRGECRGSPRLHRLRVQHWPVWMRLPARSPFARTRPRSPPLTALSEVVLLIS
jgi:hypothetical protein